MSAREIGKQALPVMIGKYIAYAINFLIIILLTRQLGPENYGIYSTGIAIISLLQAFNTLGLILTIPYLIPKALQSKNEKLAKGYYKTSLNLQIITSTITSIALYILSDTLETAYNVKGLATILKIFSIGNALFTLINYFPNVFQAFKKLQYNLLLDVTTSITRLIALALTLNLGLAIITGAHVLSMAATLIVILIITYKKVIPKVKPENVSYKFMIKTSIVPYFSIIISNTILYLNSIVLAFFPSEVSYVSIAQRIGLIIIQPASSLAMALYPSVSSKNSKEKARHEYTRITFYSTIITSFLSFAFIAISNEAVKIVFGDKYIAGILTMQLITIGYFLNGCFQPLSSLFLGLGRKGVYTKSLAIQGIFSVPLTIILGILYKSTGAAIAFLISQLAYGIYMTIKARKEKIYFTFKTFIKTIITSIIASAIYFLPQEGIINTIIKGIIFTIIFTATGLIIKTFTIKDIKTIIKRNQQPSQ